MNPFAIKYFQSHFISSHLIALTILFSIFFFTGFQEKEKKSSLLRIMIMEIVGARRVA